MVDMALILSQMAFPIFKHSEPDQYEFVATCLTCSYAGKKFLLNAGHTIDDAKNNGYSLRAILKNGNIYDVDQVFHENSKRLEGVDIAVTPITHSEEQIFGNLMGARLENDFPASQYKDWEQVLRFFGYPASKNKRRELAVRSRANSIYFDALEILPPFNETISSFATPEKHLIAEYDGIDKETGQKIPNPAGLSGGPVMRIYHITDPQTNKRQGILDFVGIAIEQHISKGFLVALKKEAILEYMESQNIL